MSWVSPVTFILSKITVQVFKTIFSKSPQIITNLTEDTELASPERLESYISDYHLAYRASVTYLEWTKFKLCYWGFL